MDCLCNRWRSPFGLRFIRAGRAKKLLPLQLHGAIEKAILNRAWIVDIVSLICCDYSFLCLRTFKIVLYISIKESNPNSEAVIGVALGVSINIVFENSSISVANLV